MKEYSEENNRLYYISEDEKVKRYEYPSDCFDPRNQDECKNTNIMLGLNSVRARSCKPIQSSYRVIT